MPSTGSRRRSPWPATNFDGRPIVDGELVTLHKRDGRRIVGSITYSPTEGAVVASTSTMNAPLRHQVEAGDAVHLCVTVDCQCT